MAGDGEDAEGQGRLTRAASFIFLHTEHAIYAALGLLLALTALVALIEAANLTWEAMRALGGADKILEVVDRLLFLLMLIEILHTVRVSMRSGRLTCEPFLIVGLIATVRRILLVTLESSETGMAPKPDGQSFDHSMTELVVLAGLTLVLVVSIYIARRSRAAAKG